MKVLYVVNMYPSAKHIHDGIFIKEQIEYLKKEYNLEYEVYLVDGLRSKFNYLKSIFIINGLVNREKYDLIHIHYGLSGIFLIFNPFIKLPTVVTLHGTDIQSGAKKVSLIKTVTKLVVRRASRIIVVNEQMIDILKKYKCKVVKIPCGIDTEKFDLGRNNIGNKSFLIGFPADKRRTVKNYTLFKEIVEKLNKRGYDIKTLEFKNFTREQVAINLSKLDCLLMTSLSEGSPQIIKEALACGVPIISSNVGDVKSLLQAVKNCYVINSFIAEDFVEKIIEIIKLRPDKRAVSGKEKLELLELDQKSVCSKIFQLYKHIL
jgi:teichuronic acid biosynthesis glycosyltransferase TuaC